MNIRTRIKEIFTQLLNTGPSILQAKCGYASNTKIQNHQESGPMVKTISNEEIEHMQDPIAQRVWRLWVERGEALLVDSITSCEEVPESTTVDYRKYVKFIL